MRASFHSGCESEYQHDRAVTMINLKELQQETDEGHVSQRRNRVYAVPQVPLQLIDLHFLELSLVASSFLQSSPQCAWRGTYSTISSAMKRRKSIQLS